MLSRVARLSPMFADLYSQPPPKRSKHAVPQELVQTFVVGLLREEVHAKR